MGQESRAIVGQYLLLNQTSRVYLQYLTYFKKMINFWQDQTLMYINNVIYQNSLPYWSYFPLLYYTNQTHQTYEKQQQGVDESSNQSIQLKRQEKSSINQVQVILTEEIPKKTENIKKSSKKRSQDANYANKSQKGDRNLNSIVIRNFVNFLKGHSNLQQDVSKIVQQKNLNIKPQDFINLLRKEFNTRQPYVGVGRFKKFIEIGQQSHKIRLITLILMRKFISVDFFTVMLNSRKVSKSAKEKELRHGKRFWREFCQQLK